MFQGMKVRSQLLLFTSVTFLLFVVAMVFAVGGMNRTEQSFKAFLTHDQALLLSFNEMYAQGLQSGQALRNILLDPSNRKAYDNLAKAVSDFDTAFGTARKITAGDKEKTTLLNHVEELLKKQRSARDAVLAAVTGNDLEGAKVHLNKEETPAWRELRQVLMDSIDANRQEAGRTQTEMEQAVAGARSRVIGFGVLALVAATVIAFLITRSLTRQLGGEPHYAAGVASKVAQGDLSMEVSTRSGDTVSLLYSMKTMRDSLARTMAEIQEVVAAAAEGDFSRRVDLSGKTGFARDLGAHINQLNTDLMKQLGGKPAYAVEVARRIAGGDLSVEVEKQAEDSESLLAAMAVMRANLARTVDDMRRTQDETARIKNALDNAATNVMIADNDGRIIYLNKSVHRMLKLAEADIRKSMPHFTADQVQGQSIDHFHRQPAHQRELLDGLKDTYQSIIHLGGRTFRLAATPVFNETGERVGTSVEWFDATHETRIESEIGSIVNAALLGDFSKRINLADKEGFMKDLGVGFNQLMETSELALADVERVLGALSKGDLTQAITADYQGTFAKLKDSTNTTVANLKQLVAQIKEAVDAIGTASKEIAHGNQDLSQRTEEQASSLEETASSMEELTATVKQNAENARQANQLAMSASDVALKGGNVVRASVQTMAAISASSKKIADIIGVIDGIAFQTNILALNAAVEAARAGEQGRGFAVVAGEVRNLAQRSANAAKEIKSLITDSVDKVESGTREVNEAGQTMEEIVTSIKRVTDIMAEISAASVEQSSGIEQVNQAITQMDDATQQNAALVEEAAAAAESMEEQADGLARGVAAFKLEGAGGGEAPATFNFNSARAKHFLWKGRIRDYLDGKSAMTLSQAVSHRDCDLGKWLYAEGVKAFGHLPAMQTLLPIHEQLHKIIRQVIELKEAGNLDGAETEFMQIGPISQQIIELLYAIEQGSKASLPALAKK